MKIFPKYNFLSNSRKNFSGNIWKAFKVSDSLFDKNLSLFIFSVIYYGIIIFLSGYLNVWEDEIYSLNTSSGTLQYALHQSINFESQPPVYFLLLTIWRFISDSVLWARLLNVFLIFISQILIYRFVIKVANRRIATISAILLLLNPTTVFTLFEIRLFALLILLSLVIIISFYNTYYNNEITPGKRILFILFAIIGLFTQFFFGFLLFANAVSLLIEKKKRIFWLYILDMILPVCLVLLYIPQILLSINVQTSLVPVPHETLASSLFEVSRVLFNRIMLYTIALTFVYSALKIWIVRAILMILLFISLNYDGIKKSSRSLLPIFIVSLVICFFFAIIHCLFGAEYSAYKYTTILFMPLFILLAFVLRLIKQRFLYFWLILLASFYLTSNFDKYRELYKRTDYVLLSNDLEKNEKKEEPIFVYRNISADILRLYYRGTNKIIPFPEAISYNKQFGPESWLIKDQDIKKLDETLTKDHNFYIIIVDDSGLRGFNESRNILMDFLLNNFKLIKEKSYKGRTILYEFSGKTD